MLVRLKTALCSFVAESNFICLRQSNFRKKNFTFQKMNKFSAQIRAPRNLQAAAAPPARPRPRRRRSTTTKSTLLLPGRNGKRKADSFPCAGFTVVGARVCAPTIRAPPPGCAASSSANQIPHHTTGGGCEGGLRPAVASWARDRGMPSIGAMGDH